jgi:hypothetical protein
MPPQKPCDLAFAFRISGKNLKAVPVPVEVVLVNPDASGKIILHAREADIHGETPKYEESGGKDQIGYWADSNDYVSWNVNVTRPGKFKVSITYSCAAGAEGSGFTVEATDQKLEGKSQSTGSWASYRTDELGTIELPGTGKCLIAVKPKSEPRWKVIGLKSVVLEPI